MLIASNALGSTVQLRRILQDHRVVDRYRPVAGLYLVAALLVGWWLPRLQGPIASVTARVGQDQVIAFLSAVSSGMMAFTGIVFALLFILLQFGSTAYSPHIVPLLTRNRTLNHASGIFTGTFVYSLMALRGVDADSGKTSALVLWVAFLWLMASVFMLLRLVGVFATLTITDVLDMLGEIAHREIERVYGPAKAEAALASASRTDAVAPRVRAPQTLSHRGMPRYVVSVDTRRLVAMAQAADATIRVAVAVGDSITAGGRLAEVEGVTPIPDEELRAGILLGHDRTYERGPKHAMRLLVDIAIRALSPAVNDPTTAVHSLDQIEAILHRLGESDLDIGKVRDSSGVVRLVYPAATWEEYLELGVTEIQHYGAQSVQIERRLAALFTLLRTTLPESRRPAVERLAGERLVAVQEAFPAQWLRDKAEPVDRQGVGHPWLAADTSSRA
jgi:uncharacterized membrane protein